MSLTFRELSASGRPVYSNTNSMSLGRTQPCCNYYTNVIYSHNAISVYGQILIYAAEGNVK